MWDTALAILKGKYVALNVYVLLKDKEKLKRIVYQIKNHRRKQEINWKEGKEIIDKKGNKTVYLYRENSVMPTSFLEKKKKKLIHKCN